MSYNAKSIVDEAREEVVEQKAKEAKTKIKAHLIKMEAAKMIVANLERELEVLVEQVNAELNG